MAMITQDPGQPNEDEVAKQLGIIDEREVKIVNWMKRQFDIMKSARMNVEKQWYLNMCFYRGRQNVAFRQQIGFIQSTTGQLYIPPAPYYRSRPVINRVRPIIRGELAKLTSQKPTAYIIPATSDDDDLFAAQAGEQIWESLFTEKKVPAIFRRALWWNQVCGNSFVKAYWDPTKIDYTSSDPNGQVGEICYEPVTPFNLFVPDLNIIDLDEQPFVIHAQLKSPAWVRMNFPDAKVTQGDQRREILDNEWLGIEQSETTAQTQMILCLELWAKPGKLQFMPKGGVLLAVGDSLVGRHIEGLPYQHKCYPFAKLDNIPTGKFYTDSTINDLIPLQREYNRTRGQVIEAKNRMAKPQLAAERGSVDPAKITSEPGQVIEYQPGTQPPQPIPLQPLPNYVLEELDRILQDMSDISGQHEVSKGQVPPGVTAATAINYLQEQDDSMMSSTFVSLEEAFEKVARMSLNYVQQFWDTPRIIKTTGDDQFFDALTFKGSDLRGNTDIKVEAGSALPLSKSAKQAFVMDLIKLGIVDGATGLEVMELGGIAKIYEAVKVDVRQAQRENLRMAQIDDATYQQFQMMGQEGGVVPVNTWDNHMVHIDEHNKYRKSQAFEKVSEASRMEFEMHVQMHQLALSTGQMGTNIAEMTKGLEAGTPEEESSGEGGNQFMPDQQAESETFTTTPESEN